MHILKVNDNKEYYEQIATWIYDAFVSKKTPEIGREGVEEKLKNSNIISFIALDNKKPLGTVSIFENDLEARKDLTPWLASLYVSEEARGLGVAKKLIEQVKEESKFNGFKKLYLRTTTAGKYYQNLGWTLIDTQEDSFDKNIEVYEINL